MFFFQCLIVILEKCLSLYTDWILFLIFVWPLKGPLKYDEWIHEEKQPSFLSGCRNLDVAAKRCAVMTTWSNPRAGFATPYVTVPLILCVQWVKVGDDCSFLVPYRRKPKVTIFLGSVRQSVRRLSVRHVKILSSPDFFFTSFDILTWYLVCGYIWMSYSLSSNFVPVEWFVAELWPLNMYFLFKLLVVRTFFWRPMRYWFDIWYIVISNI
jgi:hypothetical protein